MCGSISTLTKTRNSCLLHDIIDLMNSFQLFPRISSFSSVVTLYLVSCS